MSKNIATLKCQSRVNQGHWKWYLSIDRVWFLLVFYSNSVHKTHCFSDFRLQKCRDLENWVKSASRLLKMSPFDTAHMTSYRCSIVTMALSHVVSEIFNVKNVVTLKLGLWVTQGNQDRHGSIRCLWLFLLTFHSNHGPISYCYRDKWGFQSKIANLSHSVYFAPRRGVPQNWNSAQGVKKLEWWGYQAEQKVWRYLQPCGYNAPTWWTDVGRRDGRSDTGGQQRLSLHIASRFKKIIVKQGCR